MSSALCVAQILKTLKSTCLDFSGYICLIFVKNNSVCDHFWPTVLLAVPLVQCVVCRLSVVVVCL